MENDGPPSGPGPGQRQGGCQQRRFLPHRQGTGSSIHRFRPLDVGHVTCTASRFRGRSARSRHMSRALAVNIDCERCCEDWRGLRRFAVSAPGCVPVLSGRTIGQQSGVERDSAGAIRGRRASFQLAAVARGTARLRIHASPAMNLPPLMNIPLSQGVHHSSCTWYSNWRLSLAIRTETVPGVTEPR